jgi:hypothetical protein
MSSLDAFSSKPFGVLYLEHNGYFYFDSFKSYKSRSQFIRRKRAYISHYCLFSFSTTYHKMLPIIYLSSGSHSISSLELKLQELRKQLMFILSKKDGTGLPSGFFQIS